jgi:DNA polymerase-3 subunit alpha
MGLEFIHLQCSSEYTLRQGLIKVNNLVGLATKHEMPAIAITDRDNLFGMVKFYRKAMMSKVKPIIGCEVNIRYDGDETGTKVLLYCKSIQGYKNLALLITKAYQNRENSGDLPYIKASWLDKKAVAGLLAIVVSYESNYGEDKQTSLTATIGHLSL